MNKSYVSPFATFHNAGAYAASSRSMKGPCDGRCHRGGS